MSIFKLDIWQQAEDDLNNIFNWYETQRENLGNLFLLKADDCVKRILRNPSFASFVSKPVRSTSLNKFPYTVYYFLNDDLINIIAIIHQSRKPGTWMRKH